MLKKINRILQNHAMTGLWALSFLFLTILFIRQPGFLADYGTFWAWSQKLATRPLTQFYEVNYFADYLPGYLYVLKILGHLSIFFKIDSQSTLAIILFKTPSLLANIILVFLYMKHVAKPALSIEKTVMQLAVVLAPCLLYNILSFGQVDTMICLIVVGILLAMKQKKVFWIGGLSALAFATKPQFLFLFPFLVLWVVDCVYQKTFSLKTLLISMCFFLLCLGILFAPFWWHEPLGAIKHFLSGLESYDYFSVNAFNLPYMSGGNWAKMQDRPLLRFFTYGSSLWGIASVFYMTYRLGKPTKFNFSDDQKMTFGALTTLLIFFLAPKMHERYSLIAYAFYFFIALNSPQHFISYLCFSVASIANQAAVMDHFYGAKQDIDGPIAYGCIFLNALSILFLNKGFNDSFGSKTEKIHKVKEKYQTFIANLQVSQKKMLFAVVLLAAVATTFVRLGSTEIPKTGAFPPANLIVNLPLGSLPNHLWVFSHGAEGTIDVECGTQQNLKKFKIDMSYSWFYGWKETDISGCGSDISLAFKIANGGKIGELAFYSNSSFVSPITVCEGTKCIPATNSVFFDEPKLDQQNFQHGTYFDEVYYARAVTELLAGKYPWENTHPALGKFIMTWWIQLTDLNPLQWRTMNAFFGVCLCILVFFMLMDLTGNFNITLFGSLFVIFDFSRITLSRIATIDIMTCFFMTGSYWILGRIVRDFTVRNKSFITLKNCVFLALFLSFAISIKWNAVFTVVACFCVLCGFILQRILKGLKVDYARILGALSIIFVIAPTVIYFLSFQPFHWYLSTGYSFDKFLQDQVNMYQYHSNLKATHGFSSPFWSWPFIQRPMWFYTDRALDEGWYYTITVLGNPLIWWAFFPAIVFLFMRKYFSRNMPTLVFFLAFCAQFFCWMIASRITFIYHFLPSAVFGCILLAIALNELLQKYRYFVTAYLIGAGTCVVLFWPVVTGLKVSQNYAQYLKWFSSWYF